MAVVMGRLACPVSSRLTLRPCVRAVLCAVAAGMAQGISRLGLTGVADGEREVRYGRGVPGREASFSLGHGERVAGEEGLRGRLKRGSRAGSPGDVGCGGGADEIRFHGMRVFLGGR